MTTLQERLEGANTAQTELTDKENAQRITQEMESNSLRVRQDLADILGCSVSNVPQWYIDQNPTLLMSLDGLTRSAGSALAKADLRQNFATAVAHRESVQDNAMAQRYRGVILTDHNGGRSTLVVEHAQSTSSGKARFRKTANYKSDLPSVFQMRLVDFAGDCQSDWVDNIGMPEQCTLTENSASVLFPESIDLSSSTGTSVEALCASLRIDYWFRPSSYVVVGLFNGSTLKQSIAVPFDNFANARTSLFNCAAESGDNVQFMTTALRDEKDAMKAIKVIHENTAPNYFKWSPKLEGVFL